jgi:preprotein translocase subunit SecA
VVKILKTLMKGAEAATDTREKQQPVRAEVKIGRNDPCPCGSGKNTNNATAKKWHNG